MIPQTPINVAVVGFGMSATVFHLPFISTNSAYNVMAIVQRNGHEATAAFPTAIVYRTVEDMLTNDRIDLVIITTPNTTHFSFAKASLLAGKHVVLEKPFTNTTAEALELIELSKQCGKLLSVYQNRRYVSDYLTIKKILNQNLLGPVHEYICHFDRYRPDPRTYAFWREAPEPGAGILYDLGSHLIDQALSLFGLPLAVTAEIKMQRPHSVVDDYFDLRLDFGTTTAILKSSMLVREMGPRYMVHGPLGSYIKNGDDPQEELLKIGVLPTATDWGKEPDDIAGLLHTAIDGKIMRQHIASERGDFGLYYRRLSQSILGDAPLFEKPEHGYNVIRIIELGLQSQAEKRTIPVTNMLEVAYE